MPPTPENVSVELAQVKERLSHLTASNERIEKVLERLSGFDRVIGENSMKTSLALEKIGELSNRITHCEAAHKSEADGLGERVEVVEDHCQQTKGALRVCGWLGVAFLGFAGYAGDWVHGKAIGNASVNATQQVQIDAQDAEMRELRGQIALLKARELR